MTTPQAMELLRKIALGDKLELSPEQQNALGVLFDHGFVRKLDPMHKSTMNQSYEELQEQHLVLVEAKACVERIGKRSAPKSGLGGLLGFGSGAPVDKADDSKLLELLNKLNIKIRDVEEPNDIEGRLEKIRDRVIVDARDCLDRMATIDRELKAQQRQRQEGTLAEPVGYISLTDNGRKKLPEHLALEELETTFNTVCGPRRHKIDDFGHFREDPTSLLMLMIDNPFGATVLTQRAVEFESLVESYEKVGQYVEQKSFRTRNAFLMRLCLAFRHDMRKAYQLCNREKLQALLDRGRTLVGNRLSSADSLIVMTLDLLISELVRGAEADDTGRLAPDVLFPEILQLFVESSLDRYLEDKSLLRLSLAMHGRWQSMSGPHPVDILDLIKNQISVIKDAKNASPADLLQDNSRWLFGYHLAHLAGFEKDRLKSMLLRYKAVESAFLSESRERLAPIQIVLHALVSLQRMEMAGLWVEPKKYAATFRRVLRYIQNERDFSRILQANQIPEVDTLHLAAYITARTYFRDPDMGSAPQRIVDVGMAGVYECPDRNRTPFLGSAFGTLLIT